MQGLGQPAKKAEIDAILEHFSIDAANPIICLTQASSFQALLTFQCQCEEERGIGKAGVGCHLSSVTGHLGHLKH